MTGLPGFRYIFRLWDGTTIRCLQQEAKRQLDRRGSWEEPRIVWDLPDPRGGRRRVWPEEIMSWDQEAL